MSERAAETADRCGCCGTQTIPPTPGTDEEGWYCEECGAAWTTPTGPSEPFSCYIHRVAIPHRQRMSTPPDVSG